MSTLAEQIEWCRSHAEGGSDMARDVLATLEGLAAPGETPLDDAELKDAVGRAICKSRACEGINCCQWPANRGRTQCPVDSGGYDDAARDAIAAYDRFAAQREAAAPVSGAPTDDDLEVLIQPLWLAAKPSREAQSIRSRLSTDFDDPKHRQWVSDFIPGYVWDLVDIAAQRGMTAAATKARREALDAIEAIPCCWGSLSFEVINQLVRALSPAPQNPADAAPESE